VAPSEKRRVAQPEQEPLTIKGQIRELDRDNWTFIVRHDGQEHACIFAEGFDPDEVIDAFADEVTVEVIGWRRGTSAPVEVVDIRVGHHRPGGSDG